MDFYLLYELGFDSQLTWPIVTVTIRGLGYLILARKKGWLDGRGGKGGEGGEGGEGGGDGGSGDGGCGDGE